MLTHAAILALLMGATHATQRPVVPHVFLYQPGPIQDPYRPPHITPEAAGAEPTKKANLIPTSVSISGNFGGIFNVTGIGSGTTQTQTNVISVTTNRGLTFWANSFKPLMASNTSETGMGSITYSMALYQGTPSQIGALVSGPVSGTDAGFSGQALTLNSAQVPANGNLVLVLTRTLTMNQSAMGAYKLVGTGNIGVSIN